MKSNLSLTQHLYIIQFLLFNEYETKNDKYNRTTSLPLI
jgi:hypothetical protein